MPVLWAQVCLTLRPKARHKMCRALGLNTPKQCLSRAQHHVSRLDPYLAQTHILFSHLYTSQNHHLPALTGISPLTTSSPPRIPPSLLHTYPLSPFASTYHHSLNSILNVASCHINLRDNIVESQIAKITDDGCSSRDNSAIIKVCVPFINAHI